MAKSLKQASKAATYRSNVEKLDGLGVSKDSLETVLSAVELALGQFIERVHENINKEDMPVTGGISNISLQGDNDSIKVMGNEWLIYQDRGTNGSKKQLYDTPHKYTDKMPPVDVFKDWIRRKNINLRNNESYRGKPSPFKELTDEEMIEKAAWGMAMKVFQEGFKPRKIYSKEIPKLLEDLKELIGEVLIQQINQDIRLKNPDTERIIIKM